MFKRASLFILFLVCLSGCGAPKQTAVIPPQPPPVASPPPQSFTVRGVVVGELSCSPRLDYPALSRRQGEQGTVFIYLLVDVDGSIRDSKIAQGSGYEYLDTMTKTGIDQSSCKFIQRSPDKVPKKEWKIVKITWRLED